MAEASGSRTHHRQETCRPPVLKTGAITGPHALPLLQYQVSHSPSHAVSPGARRTLRRVAQESILRPAATQQVRSIDFLSRAPITANPAILPIDSTYKLPQLGGFTPSKLLHYRYRLE